MKGTIDGAGRLVVPKQLRDELGFAPGLSLEFAAIDGHLEITVPSRVTVEQGPHGVRFVAESEASLDAEQIRELTERGRR